MSNFLQSLTHKKTLRSVFLVTLMLTATPPFSPAQTKAPAEPVAPPLTPEQKAFMDAAYHTSPDAPSPKADLQQFNKDGSPYTNFCKIDGAFRAQHEAFLKRKAEPIGVLFIGDDITAGWNRVGKAVWTKRYAKLDAANFGISGDRTENVLWRIANGELDGIAPKVVILMIGSDNNKDTATRITAGVTAVVKKINAKLPQSKLLLLGIFPRGVRDNDHLRKKMAAVNAELAKLSDGQKTFYLEIWEQFLAEDGSIPKEVMPDALHLTARGYQIWADAMQPTLDALLK